jgi:hypothetical protein
MIDNLLSFQYVFPGLNLLGHWYPTYECLALYLHKTLSTGTILPDKVFGA